jgi:dihydroflavonol-4-reductase
MEIIVTGADGFLGNNLLRELLKRYTNVSVLLEPGKNNNTLNDLPVKRLYGNILDKKSLESAFANKQVVYHCAASTSVFPARNELVNKINIEGSQNVIDVCLQHSIQRVIYVGTANSFSNGNLLNNPGVEGTPYISGKYGLDYMDSKYKSQELFLNAFKEKKLPVIIVNPTFMLGPFDSRPGPGAMIIAVHKGKIPGYSSGGKNYVAVKDVATALANAITMGELGECYIAGNINLTYKDAFEMIAKTIGAPPPKRKLSDGTVILYGTVNSFLAGVFGYFPTVTKELATISCDNHFYSSEKARRVLQMPQTPIDIAVRESFEWFEQNGYLK